MMDRYDDEIRELEERLVRERAALVHRAEDLTHTAKAAAVSPKGLFVAAALGFLLGELSRPRHRHHDGTPRKLGVGGLIGGMALTLIKAQYGSPFGFGRAMWEYAAARRARHPSTSPSPPSADVQGAGLAGFDSRLSAGAERSGVHHAVS